MTAAGGGMAAVIIAGALFASINVYVLMGGADLGAGVWDLLASGPRREPQRSLIAAAIGPIWEADHIWLILAVVLCFTAFPGAFAVLATVLHIPLALALIGIVLRGSAFVFRSYGGPAARQRWGRTFAIASLLTPLLLGVATGAISTDAVGVANAAIGTGSFAQIFVAPWLAPFPIAIGLLAVALVGQLAATYLTVAAPDAGLADDFRRRALAATGAVAVLAAVATVLARREYSFAWGLRLAGPRSWLWIAITVAAGVAGTVFLLRRRYRAARIAVGAEASLILWGWAASEFPYLIPPHVTIQGAAAPRTTLITLLWALGLGLVILIPSLRYLLRHFTAGTIPPSPEAGDRP